MDNVLLISLVERHEELYNPDHRQYHNLARREAIWKEIGKETNESGKACKERWTKIRDNHRKALALRKTKSYQGTKMKPAKYTKELQFLLPYIQDEDQNDTNFDPFTNTDPSSPASPSSEEASPKCDSADSSTFLAKRSMKTSRSCDENSTAMGSKEYFDPRIVPATSEVNSDEHDPLIGFFLNMGRTVKGFPIEEQLRIKSELFMMVNNTELNLAMQMEDRKFH